MFKTLRKLRVTVPGHFYFKINNRCVALITTANKNKGENLIMKTQVRELTTMAVIAALYVALCLAFAPISYGPVQFRVAEVLIVLPFYNKKYSFPIILGTFIANIFMYGLADMIFGTCATAIICLIIIVCKNKIIIAPAAAIINGVIIGLMLKFIFNEPGAFWYIMSTVALGEFAVVLVGVLAFHTVEKTNKKFINLLKE